MLRTPILHPEILHVLGKAGHGSQVVIADSNYAFSTNVNPGAAQVYLNFAPGKLTVTDVLEGLVASVPLEVAHGIAPDDGNEPDIFADYRRLLPEGVPLNRLGRFPFYDAARDASTTLMIATGEQRVWACIILTIGYILPE